MKILYQKMKIKTNYSKSVLTNFTIAFFSLGLVWAYSINIITSAQNTPQKVFIENKANIRVPNDSQNNNNETIAQDYVIKNPTTTSSNSVATSSVVIISEIPKPITKPIINQISVLGYNININNSQQNTPQTQELQQYALAGGGSWKQDKLQINNPVEVIQFVIKYPNLAQYVFSNLIRSGGQQLSLQSVLIPLILSILLISSIANLVNKKFKYNTK